MAEFNTYQDAPNYHVDEDRSFNVVERINSLKNHQYTSMEDDSIEEGELKKAINRISMGLGTTSSTLSNLSTEIGTVPAGHTICGDITTINQTLGSLSQTVSTLVNRPKILKAADIELSSSTSITTADLYGALKENMRKGDILVDEFNLSDGPSSLSSETLQHVGILAYCTADNVTADGENSYSRAYMIASSKATSDIWNCQLIDGTYTWVQISA